MRQVIWDSFDDNYSGNQNENLFPFIDLNNDDEMLDWLTKDIEGKFRSRTSRLETLRKYDAMFKGISYTGRTANDDDDDGFRKPKSICNFINEMVEAKVAQRSRFKPGISVIPANVDSDDENKAEGAKTALVAQAQLLDFETVLANGDKINFLSGESYTYVNWNKYKGGANPELDEARANGIIPKYEDGTEIDVAFNGDIDITVLGPDRAYHQLGKKKWEDVDDCSVIEWIHIDELKADYPEHADDIVPSETIYHNYFTMEERSQYAQCAMVVTYYHKPTRHLKAGKYVKYIPGCILEKSDFPYDDGVLPIIFDTDIDVQGEITGRPFVGNIEKLQRLHDMVSSSMARAFAIGSSPKWVYPKGSVDANKLGNNYSSLEFKGPMAPQLVGYNAISPVTFDMLGWTEKSIEKASTVFGISRGEPPKGIKAAVALQFLDEQEMQRESRGMAKRQKRIISLNKLVLSRMQQFYTPEDGRIMRILGEDNQYLALAFSELDINGDFDIRLENASALPDSKTGKIAAILDLNTATQANPMFSPEKIAQMLDLGNDRRFKGESNSGIRAAQFKLQQILKKELQPEPKKYDDLLSEYDVFTTAIRQREYKGDDEQIVHGLETYIRGLEYLMWEKAQMNPMFMQKVSMNMNYPMFYMVPIIQPAPPAPIKNEKPITKMDSISKMSAEQAALEPQGA